MRVEEVIQLPHVRQSTYYQVSECSRGAITGPYMKKAFIYLIFFFIIFRAGAAIILVHYLWSLDCKSIRACQQKHI